MIARGRVKRVELAHRSRHGVTGGGFVVGVQVGDQVRIGDQVLTLAEWGALETDHKVIVTRREEEV